jgi:Ca-activated chloride channel family protein
MNIVNKLNNVTPQGHTPIAFSIFSCLNDFPRDPNAKNSIILVTDGVENCEGDVCALGLELEKRRITMKPFIIGMGLTEEEKGAFDCIGTYYDAADQQGFKNSMNAVMSQAMHNTTTTVNLIQKGGKPLETDVEMSFYDHHSGALVYNMTHTMNEDSRPDTLYVSPIGIYDLKIHTIPSVVKENIELTPGRHNIIGVNVHLGGLQVNWNRPDGKQSAKVLVRKTGTDSTLYVTDISRIQKFLTGYYDIEVLTIPEKKYDSVLIKQSELTKLKLPNVGTFRINVTDVGYASVYKVVKGEYFKVYEFYDLRDYAIIPMLPGNYAVVYQGRGNYDSEETQHKRFRITPFKATSVTFN